jgi:hypothetical protein
MRRSGTLYAQSNLSEIPVAERMAFAWELLEGLVVGLVKLWKRAHGRGSTPKPTTDASESADSADEKRSASA